VLIGTSEPRGYLRTGVNLNPGETIVPGVGHAEADIVNFAQRNWLRLLEVGATRSICPSCATHHCWSPGAHDAILQHTFGNTLSPADIARLQQSSRVFDRNTQSANQSFMHSMRLRDQSIADAVRLRDLFIAQTLEDARRLAKASNRNAALDRLGEACHPIMDSSSPVHTNTDGTPKAWNPMWPFGHSPTDSIGSETINNLTPQILQQQNRLLNDAYQRVFGP